MRFSFCGDFKIIKDKLVESGMGKNQKPFLKIKFVVNTGTDSAFVEAFAAVQDELKATDRDGEKYTVPWDERFNPDMVSRSMYNFIVGGFDERQTFLSQYDQIQYLEKVLSDYEGRVVVTGKVNKSYYNGQWYDNYAIQNVYAASENDKPRLYIQGDVIYNKECVDTSTYAKDQILSVNGYIEQYIDKDHPKALVPQVFVFNASKVNKDDPNQAAALSFREACIIPKSKKWYKLRWEMVLKNGQEEVEWDESQLTDFQKAAYKTGMWKLDEFKPTKKIYGERITELRLVKPALRDEYLNGPIEFGGDQTVESLIYRPGQVITGKVKEEDIFGQDSSDIDDLFA